MKSQQLDLLLNKYFDSKSFRSAQKEIIESILEGNDTFVRFPTGMGKSLCYQLPSLILPGIVVVVPVWTAKWWILAAVIALSLFFAIPRRLRNATIWRQLTALPHLIWEMLRNLNKLDKDNKEFSHTQHGNEG